MRSTKTIASKPSRKPLEVLSGHWDMEIRWSPKTHELVGGLYADARGVSRVYRMSLGIASGGSGETRLASTSGSRGRHHLGA
jgi:hypothetical protein